ncbi:hypothetical protein LRB11_13495 [Ectothiorhodospira haloalkaliphila]|uniref:hypothetical protein n=1 Tax=Ectothiorhodospira haloalkaliphila TaxID=421628 RepID=UPI001EE7EDF2|nr:hypothetical protein [Ectothiorhodospira haloalkaliphila]MCG5525933.1 hypothetical protein [Ectothiorhodospira haloalkaliphila]
MTWFSPYSVEATTIFSPVSLPIVNDEVFFAHAVVWYQHAALLALRWGFIPMDDAEVPSHRYRRPPCPSITMIILKKRSFLRRDPIPFIHEMAQKGLKGKSRVGTEGVHEGEGPYPKKSRADAALKWLHTGTKKVDLR